METLNTRAKIELLEIADMHQPTLDLRHLAAVYVPASQLQACRKKFLRPFEAVSPLSNLWTNDVSILHAAARDMSVTNGDCGSCARLGAI